MGIILNLLAGALERLIKVLGNYFQVSIVWEAFIQLVEFLTEIDPCECKLTSYCLILYRMNWVGNNLTPIFPQPTTKSEKKTPSKPMHKLSFSSSEIRIQIHISNLSPGAQKSKSNFMLSPNTVW